MAGYLRNKNNRFARLVHSKGSGFAISKGIRVVSRPFIEIASIRFFAADLNGRLPQASTDSTLSFVPAAPTEAAPLMMDRSGDEIAEEIAYRFSRGDRCYTARDASGNIVHARWLTAKPTYIPELNLHVVPTCQQLYMYDGYTRAEARRRGIDGAMRKFIFRMAREEGVHEVISYVYSHNLPGIKAAQKLQAEVGNVRYIKLFQRWHLASGRRKLRGRVSLLTDTELSVRRRSTSGVPMHSINGLRAGSVNP